MSFSVPFFLDRTTLSCLLFSLSITFVTQAAERWVPVPLTSPNQAEAGIAGGEGFQKIVTITYAPSDPSIVFMGSDTTQVWKSTDGGWNWKPANNGFDANGARSIIVHPNDPSIVLAAGFLGKEPERYKKGLKARQGIYLSTNGGNEWKFIQSADFFKQKSTGSLFAFDSRTVDQKNFTAYAGSYDKGLLITQDGGHSWSKTPFRYRHIIDMQEMPGKPGTIIIATDKGLYRYDGSKIESLGIGLPSSPLSIEVSPAEPLRVFAALGKNGIYRSNDGGKTFSKASAGLPGNIFASDLAISPVNADRLYMGTHLSRAKGPFYTDNGGSSWFRNITTTARNLTDGGGFWFSSPFVAHPTEPDIALTVSNGKARVLRTEDGGKSWFYSGNGYSGGRVIDMAFPAPDEMLLSLTDHGLWKTTDDGLTFTHLELSAKWGQSSSAIAEQDRTIVTSIGGWKKQSLALSKNSGETWTIENISGKFEFIGFHPHSNGGIYAGSNRSDDGGKTWTKLKYKVLAMAPSNGDIIYGTGGGKRKAKIFRSSDRGNTWKALSIPKKGGLTVTAIAVDPRDDNRIYVGTTNGLMIHDGRRWSKITASKGLVPDSHGRTHVQAISIDPKKPKTVYLGRRAPGYGHANGVFRSDDFGKTWKEYNLNLGSYYTVWSLSINPVNGSVFMGTSQGLHKLDRD
ncbi:MAG: hypothetical protein ABW146_18005 [Candidatus Sedimenticola sp. 6PFRAG7]